MRVLALLLLVFPLAELAVMIKVGSAVGVLATIMLLLLSAVIGVWIIRIGGITTALRARVRMSQGQLPDQEMISGLFLAIAGGLLLLPGFISDVLAVLLLLPPLQRFLLLRLKLKVAASGPQTFEHEPFTQRPERSEPMIRNVIEGEYKRHDE